MADKRYAAGTIQGIAKSRGVGAWPDELPGLGPRMRSTFAQCHDCQTLRVGPDRTLDAWMRYGERPLCLFHAQERAK